MRDNINQTREAVLQESNTSNRLLILLAGSAAIALGVLFAFVFLPAWGPGLLSSMAGVAPKAYWYLSRGSGLVAYGLLWFSMALGTLITNKMARLWPGGPAAFDLHEYASLLGMVFAIFHGLILLGDHFINFQPVQILLPFSTTSYRPLWVGVGQLAFYLLVIVNLSFYVRKAIGSRTWRTIHYLSYLTFGMALVHGVLSGSDSSAGWAVWMYWLSAASLLFLLVYRITMHVVPERAKVSA